jgi:hypothetical protein
MAALAAIIRLDTGLLGSYSVANLGTAECCWLAFSLWVFEEFIAALGQSGLLDWTFLADLWIFIDTVWTVLLTVAEDLVVK